MVDREENVHLRHSLAYGRETIVTVDGTGFHLQFRALYQH